MKPCDECPWIVKGLPDIKPKTMESLRDGEWFCCHVNMGTCHGALNLQKQLNKRYEKIDSLDVMSVDFNIL